MKYQVYVFNGESLSALLEDESTPALTFDALTWEETELLCQLSVKRGFGCIVWKCEEGFTNV